MCSSSLRDYRKYKQTNWYLNNNNSKNGKKSWWRKEYLKLKFYEGIIVNVQ